MDKLKSYSRKIQITSIKENFFNLSNHGYVELYKDVNCFKLVLLSENNLKKSEFEVSLSFYLTKLYLFLVILFSFT